MEQSPSYEWSELGSETYYHKFNLYQLRWPEIDLSEYLFAAAPYGGAVAVTRDDGQFQKYRGQTAVKGIVQVYSSVGDLLCDLRWENVSIVALGWTEDEHLLVVANSGLVRHYDLLGNFSQFGLVKTPSQTSVISCKFWSHGLVAHMSDNIFLRVDDYKEPRPTQMTNGDITPESSVHSWAIIPPAFTLSRKSECLLAVGKSVFALDGNESQDMSLDHGPFTNIEVSMNGQFLALRSVDGKIWVSSSDFQRTLTEYDAGEDFQPSQIAWCGNDAVVAVSDTFLTVIGPSGDTLQYAYESPPKIAADVDGLRIFTSVESDFLRKVPDTSERIFSPGSTSAASILLDAVEQLEAKSAKADENIRLIQSYLTEAVDDCIRAAGESLSSHWQKQLLKAASFGKGFLDIYNSDEFVEMCQSLRVMNAVKQSGGLPLTLEQYIRISPEGIVDRLLQRKHHYLASRICEYLRLPSDRVYVHWACLKLQSSEEDAKTTCNAIVSKLGARKQISYEKIARTAFADGRVELAILLLDHEPRAGAQVPLLLDMGVSELALDKAIASGDPDLLKYVVFEIKNSNPLAVFFKMINDKPAAVSVLTEYAKVADQQLLKDFYYQDDRKLDSAMLVISEAEQVQDRSQKLAKTKLAAKMLRESKDHAFEARILEENIKVLQLQDALTKDLELQFAGMSLAEIIMKLNDIGHTSRAQKVATAFKLPDLTMAWLSFRSLIGQRDWHGLEKWLAKSGKRPLIPFEVMATHVHAAGNRTLATQIIARAVQASTRIETLLKLEEGLSAAREAYKVKDADSLHQALDLTKSPSERSEIESMLRSLAETK